MAHLKISHLSKGGVSAACHEQPLVAEHHDETCRNCVELLGSSALLFQAPVQLHSLRPLQGCCAAWANFQANHSEFHQQYIFGTET
jgi:hypothetical protein